MYIVKRQKQKIDMIFQNITFNKPNSTNNESIYIKGFETTIYLS